MSSTLLNWSYGTSLGWAELMGLCLPSTGWNTQISLRTNNMPLDSWAIKKTKPTTYRLKRKKYGLKPLHCTEPRSSSRQLRGMLKEVQKKERWEPCAGSSEPGRRVWCTEGCTPLSCVSSSPVLARNIFHKCLPMYKLPSSKTKIVLHLNSSYGDDLHEHKQVLKPAKGKHKSTRRTEAELLGLHFHKSPMSVHLHFVFQPLRNQLKKRHI